MTEAEVIRAAAAAFKKRDKLAAELRALDVEINQLVRKFELVERVWMMTPVKLRHEVDRRVRKKAA
jgi:hypothetical protein